MLRGLVILSAAAVSGLFGQSPQVAPKFEVADVHVSSPTANPRAVDGVMQAGVYRLRGANMVDLIRTAYDVEADDVLGGPKWLEWNRFDVIAKTPAGTTPENLKPMLQDLLADRFKLGVHKETKAVPSIVLAMGSAKPTLAEANGAGDSGCHNRPQMAQPGKVPYAMVVCQNMTMQAFAFALRGLGGPYMTGPVVDQTGLKGTWNFTLAWTARAQLAQAGPEGVTIFEAVEQQLGLKLEQKDVPRTVMVVDKVNERPSENPPGAAALLAAQNKFESGEIKPSRPGAPMGGGGFQPAGRVDLRGLPLMFLITVAYDLSPADEIVGAPEWLTGNSPRFDLTAKAPTSGGPSNALIDTSELGQMVRGLLTERFKLAVHFEDRPVATYVLLADGPKLTRADVANRTSCKVGPAPAARTANQFLPVLQATCRNMTMAQFAQQLHTMAPAYFSRPAQDATGIEGVWDFSLTFSAIPPENGGGAGRIGVPAGADVAGPVSLLDALSSQLGLKLEIQKRPAPVLVIDHIEEKPVEN
jgi:uncharacterized protein (TIGR03435 family)